MAPRFHSEALRLANVSYEEDPHAADVLRRRQAELGVPFPASFVEWYAMKGAMELLRRYSGTDQPIAAECLGDVKRTSFGIDDRLWPREAVLPFMVENQGNCIWAIELDAGDDPPVIVARDPDYEWQRHADRFSTFTACQVLDYGKVLSEDLIQLAAQDAALQGQDLAFLRSRFDEGPRTHAWPGDEQYRFANVDGRILVWDVRESQADWWIASKTKDGLEKLARTVWMCGGLSRSLYSNDERGEAVLEKLRAPERRSPLH
jgi:hypothetical protein